MAVSASPADTQDKSITFIFCLLALLKIACTIANSFNSFSRASFFSPSARLENNLLNLSIRLFSFSRFSSSLTAAAAILALRWPATSRIKAKRATRSFQIISARAVVVKTLGSSFKSPALRKAAFSSSATTPSAGTALPSVWLLSDSVTASEIFPVNSALKPKSSAIGILFLIYCLVSVLLPTIKPSSFFLSCSALTASSSLFPSAAAAIICSTNHAKGRFFSLPASRTSFAIYFSALASFKTERKPSWPISVSLPALRLNASINAVFLSFASPEELKASRIPDCFKTFSKAKRQVLSLSAIDKSWYLSRLSVKNFAGPPWCFRKIS